VFRLLTTADHDVGYNTGIEVTLSVLPGQKVACLMFYETSKVIRFTTETMQIKLAGLVKVNIPLAKAKSLIIVKIYFGRGERVAEAFFKDSPNQIFKAKLEGVQQRTFPYHSIFVLDYSGSMDQVDMCPTQRIFKEINDNRLGAVFEATSAFIKLRLNPPLVGKQVRNVIQEICSLIKFDHSATVVLNKAPISENLIAHLKFTPCGGTSYSKALSAVHDLLVPEERYTPLVIFLSDGEDSGDKENVLEMVDLMLVKNPTLTLHTIHVGSSSGGKSLLEEMANRGNGQFVATGSDVGKLVETFEILGSNVVVVDSRNL